MKQLLLLTLLALSLSACGERDQSLGASGKSGDKPWQAAATPYTAKGWGRGDKAIWENQLRTRAQTQNEYAKAE